MTEPNVLVHSDKGIATLTINRPKALNALDVATLEALEAATARVAADQSVRVVVLTGAGEKAFVAGGDIKLMAEMSTLQAQRFSGLGHRVLRALEALPMPVLAAVNGFALGGGLELAMAADVIYASDNAKFGQPEVNLGLIPGFGGCVRLPRLIGRQAAAALIYTGDVIDAVRAKELGLVSAIFPAGELMAEVQKLAQKIAARGPVAVAQAKRVLRASADMDLGAACAFETESFALLFTTSDQREGCAAFVEKRQPNFQGA